MSKSQKTTSSKYVHEKLGPFLGHPSPIWMSIFKHSMLFHGVSIEVISGLPANSSRVLAIPLALLQRSVFDMRYNGHSEATMKKKALAAAEAAGQSSLLDVSNLFGIVSPNVLCSTGRGWSPYSYGFCPWAPTWIGTIQCCISSTIKFHVICGWVITPEVIPSAENSSLPNIFLVAYVSFMDFNDQKRTAVSFMISELWATWHTSRVRQAGKSWYCVLRVWFSTQGRDSADLAW